MYSFPPNVTSYSTFYVLGHMEPVSAVAAVQGILAVLSYLKDVRNTMKDNKDECSKLFDRLEVFEEPIKSLASSNQVHSYFDGLSRFLKVCEDAKGLVQKFMHSGRIWRLTNYRQISNDFALLNNRITISCNDLNLVLQSSEVRRQEDIEYAKLAYEQVIQDALEELRDCGEQGRLKLSQVEELIQSLTSILSEMLSILQHRSLNKVEEFELMKLQKRWMADSALQYNNIIKGIDQIQRQVNDLKEMMVGEKISKFSEHMRNDRIKSLLLDTSRVKILREINRGGFGILYEGTYDDMAVAIKVISKSNGYPSSPSERENVENEAIFLRHLSYPSIVRVDGIFHEAYQSCIVLELAPYGSLWSVVSDKTLFPDSFPLTLSLAWIMDLCGAVHHIHTKGVIHKDLKAENLLVFSEPDRLKLKLCDFGSSRNEASASRRSATTMPFMALEIRDGRRATYSSDVFSVGMIVCQVIRRRRPENDDCSGQIELSIDCMKKLLQPSQSSTMDALLVMLRDCVKAEPSERPSCKRLFEQVSRILAGMNGDPRIQECHDSSEHWKVCEIENLLRNRISLPLSMRRASVKLPSSPLKSNSTWDSGITSIQTVSSDNIRPLKDLNVDEVCNLLYNLDLHKEYLVDILCRHNINGKLLCMIEEPEDLQEYGIKKADSRVLFAEIKTIKDTGVSQDNLNSIKSDDQREESMNVSIRSVNSNATNPIAPPKPCFNTSDEVPSNTLVNQQVRDGIESASIPAPPVISTQQARNASLSQASISDPISKKSTGEDNCSKAYSIPSTTIVHKIHTYSDGGVYDGEWKDEQRDGYGIYTFCSGAVYVGEWKDDKKEGYGNCTYVGGAEYEGEWKSDKREGHGTFTFNNGSTYEGEWKKDKKEGRGKLIYDDGSVYEGQWCSNYREGRGKYVCVDGSVYEGEWKSDKKEGRGKLVNKDGSVYEGQWENDKKKGPQNNLSQNSALNQGSIKNIKMDVGKLSTYSDGSVNISKSEDDRQDHQSHQYNDGSLFQGELKDGKRDGYGMLTYSDGAVYVGEWKNDKKCGTGIYTFYNGSMYEGAWRDGKKEGRGKYIYKDGSVYEGEWKNDKKEGRGKLIYDDGSVYEGEFKNGKKEGCGKYIYKDGSMYEGDWENDKKEGRGKYIYEDGSVYEGEWKNNKEEGRGKYIYKDGSVYEGEWKNDKKEGRGKLIYDDGSVYEGAWRDGKKEGRGKYIYKDGSVYEGEWENDKKVGSKSNISQDTVVSQSKPKNGKEGKYRVYNYSDSSVYIRMSKDDWSVYEGESGKDKPASKGFTSVSTNTINSGNFYSGRSNVPSENVSNFVMNNTYSDASRLGTGSLYLTSNNQNVKGSSDMSSIISVSDSGGYICICENGGGSYCGIQSKMSDLIEEYGGLGNMRILTLGYNDNDYYIRSKTRCVWSHGSEHFNRILKSKISSPPTLVALGGRNDSYYVKFECGSSSWGNINDRLESILNNIQSSQVKHIWLGYDDSYFIFYTNYDGKCTVSCSISNIPSSVREIFEDKSKVVGRLTMNRDRSAYCIRYYRL